MRPEEDIWQVLRSEWIARTGENEDDLGETRVPVDAHEGWTLRAIVARPSRPGHLMSRFAIHAASGFSIEERTTRGVRTFHTSAEAWLPELFQLGWWVLSGAPQGRKPVMPSPDSYLERYRQLKQQLAREPLKREIAAVFGVEPDTERRYRKRWSLDSRLG